MPSSVILFTQSVYDWIRNVLDKISFHMDVEFLIWNISSSCNASLNVQIVSILFNMVVISCVVRLSTSYFYYRIHWGGHLLSQVTYNYAHLVWCQLRPIKMVLNMFRCYFSMGCISKERRIARQLQHWKYFFLIKTTKKWD